MTKLQLKYSSQFKTDFKSIKKNQQIVDRLNFVVESLMEGSGLPENFRDHSLQGKYDKHRECHLLPDCLLIYKINDHQLELILIRIGSHSKLFG